LGEGASDGGGVPGVAAGVGEAEVPVIFGVGVRSGVGIAASLTGA
jgi:hypothetical protein